MKKAGLAGTLSAPGKLTVFAPTDRAFANLKKSDPALYNKVATDKKLLKSVLTYHVVGKRIPAAAATAAAKKGLKVKTVQGESIALSFKGGKIVLNGTARVVIPDVKASNGVIHAISAVLVPPSLSQPPAPTQSIVQIAAGNPDFSTLAALVQKAGLVEAISAPGPFTVFAPTNEAFAKLAKTAPATYAAVLADPALLAKVLTYHVVAGDIDSAQAISVARQNGTVKPLEGEHDLALAEGRKADPQRQRHRRHRRHPGDERRDPRNRHRDRPAQPVGLARRPGTQLPAQDGIGSSVHTLTGVWRETRCRSRQVRVRRRQEAQGMDNRALRRGNAFLAFVHAAQAVVILALSTDFSLPVTGAFMEGQPGSGLPKQDLLFDLRIGPLVAAFLLLAALDHALVALPPCRARYERGLAAGINPFRWLEYSLSASLMVVLIAQITGVSDVGRARRHLRRQRGDDLLRAGDGAAQPARPARTTLDALPARLRRRRRAVDRDRRADRRLGGAWTRTADVRLRHRRFALRAVQQLRRQQALQYKRVGRWRDYRYGERSYLWLSLVAKSLLAWQVFANVLVL